MSIDFFGKTFFDEVLEEGLRVGDIRALETYGLLNCICFQKNLFLSEIAKPWLISLFKKCAENLGKAQYLSDPMQLTLTKRVQIRSFINDVKQLFTMAADRPRAQAYNWDKNGRREDNANFNAILNSNINANLTANVLANYERAHPVAPAAAGATGWARS